MKPGIGITAFALIVAVCVFGTEAAAGASSGPKSGLTGAGASALKPKRNCRPPQPQPPFIRLKVGRVSCNNGRQVARRFLFTDDCRPGGCTVRHFQCKEKRIAYESYRINCHRRNRVVRFVFGF